MSKRRKLKAANYITISAANAVHTMQPTNIPINAIISLVTIEDPYERGKYISALANLRDDPLAALWARHQIDDAKYAAGRQWQALYEATEIGAIQGIDTTREPVDGGGINMQILTEHRRKAIRELGRCASLLGQHGDALMRDILGRSLFIHEAASARGHATRSGIEYIGKRFRECLETLAHHFGYA